MNDLYSDGIHAATSPFVKDILKAAADPNIISFAGGLPNPISFPQEALLASTERVVHEYGSKVFQYSLTAGLPQLRAFIAKRYNKLYGLNLNEDNVLITTGSQQALDLLGKTLLNKGDGVVVEKPTYLAAIQAFSLQQPKFYAVDLSEDGLDLAQLEAALDKEPKLLYMVPNFQNPTGLTYTQENREKIRKVLQDRKIVLIEDDPYGELRFEGEKLPYIGAGHLPYSLLMGTFSKIVTPGMRIGYMISENQELLSYLSTAKEASDLHTNIFSQYIIWDYLENNDLDAHIAKITALYQQQAKDMLASMERHFPKEVTYTRPQGGMFLWVTLPKGVSSLDLFPKALERRIAFVPGDPFYVDVHGANTLRLNYTNADSATIEEGISRLGELLKEAIG
jgi:2-aminoadipate transaminase